MHYWIDPGLEKTTCGDGTIFFHVPIDEKMVMKNPVPCKKDTHGGLLLETLQTMIFQLRYA